MGVGYAVTFIPVVLLSIVVSKCCLHIGAAGACAAACFVLVLYNNECAVFWCCTQTLFLDVPVVAAYRKGSSLLAACKCIGVFNSQAVIALLS
jgi:hypothetical protein